MMLGRNGSIGNVASLGVMRDAAVDGKSFNCPIICRDIKSPRPGIRIVEVAAHERAAAHQNGEINSTRAVDAPASRRAIRYGSPIAGAYISCRIRARCGNDDVAALDRMIRG